VRDGKALAFDYADAGARLQMAQRRAIEKVAAFDWAGEAPPRSCRRPSGRSELPPAPN